MRITITQELERRVQLVQLECYSSVALPQPQPNFCQGATISEIDETTTEIHPQVSSLASPVTVVLEKHHRLRQKALVDSVESKV